MDNKLQKVRDFAENQRYADVGSHRGAYSSIISFIDELAKSEEDPEIPKTSES